MWIYTNDNYAYCIAIVMTIVPSMSSAEMMQMLLVVSCVLKINAFLLCVLWGLQFSTWVLLNSFLSSFKRRINELIKRQCLFKHTCMRSNTAAFINKIETANTS